MGSESAGERRTQLSGPFRVVYLTVFETVKFPQIPAIFPQIFKSDRTTIHPPLDRCLGVRGAARTSTREVCRLPQSSAVIGSTPAPQGWTGSHCPCDGGNRSPEGPPLTTPPDERRKHRTSGPDSFPCTSPPCPCLPLSLAVTRALRKPRPDPP